MMVSKIAVMALVAVVAVPILLGYAMNLSQVTETDYKVDGEVVNVTQLLQTGTSYSYVKGEVYGNNTQFGRNYHSPGYSPDYAYMPAYVLASTVKTSLKLTPFTSDNWTPSGTQNLTGISYYYLHCQYENPTVNSVTITVYAMINGVESVWRTYNNIAYFEWDANYNRTTGIGQLTVFRYTNSAQQSTITATDVTKIAYSSSGGFTASIYGYYNPVYENKYIDLAAGFFFTGESNPAIKTDPAISFPTFAKSVLLSINLDSITASSYEMNLYLSKIQSPNDYIRFVKSTTGGVVSWTASLYTAGSLVKSYDLYYDSTRSNNTYQLLIECLEPPTADYTSATYRAELRYIGDWSTLIGAANYYQTYQFDPFSLVMQYSKISQISFLTETTNTHRTPVMRVDDSTFRTFEYPVIKDKVYDPAAFKTNPSTTLSDPAYYGDSITFGGITYTVKDGSITLGSKKVPVKGLVLSSVENDLGTYDNKIGNTIVSTTLQPSTITFNGEWNVAVSTQANVQYSVTKTSWTPGQFGWDGIDQNFLMVGLLTAIGAFIALGIYVRKTKSSLWPVLVVCGGAVVLFFVML